MKLRTLCAKCLRMNLGADPPEPKCSAEGSLSCRGRKDLSRMKISPNLKICDSEVLEKWVGFISCSRLVRPVPRPGPKLYLSTEAIDSFIDPYFLGAPIPA
jgi:hypothetical protein